MNLRIIRSLPVVLFTYGLLCAPAYGDLTDDLDFDEQSPPAEEAVDSRDVEKVPQKGEKSQSEEITPSQRENSKPPAVDPKKPAKAAKKPKKKSTPKGQDQRLPVSFSSLGASANRNSGQVFLQKDVVVTQGDFRMEAEEATVYSDPASNEVEKVIATGKVRIWKTDPGTGEKIRAIGDEVEFLAREEKVYLRDNARLWRGKDRFQGKVIIYEMKTGWVKAQQVEGVVAPEGRK